MNKKWLFSLWIACSLAQSAPYPVPDGMSVISAAQGDLDGDGIPELAIAYNNNDSAESPDSAIPRTLIVFKRDDEGNWQEMSRSDEALLDSKLPTGEEANILLFIHKGELYVASDIKSDDENRSAYDTYRFQKDDFYLVDYQSTITVPCRFYQDVLYHFLTQKMVVKTETESCSTSPNADVLDDVSVTLSKREESFKTEKKYIITMKHRQKGNVTITTPKRDKIALFL